MDLHKLGYVYVGDSSLYKLSFIELSRIIEASRYEQDDKLGVRRTDLDKFKAFDEKVRRGQVK